MGRISCVLGAMAMAVVGCSEDADEAPACPIVGTYSSVDTLVSGDCPIDSDPTTVTVSADGAGYAVALGGASGACSAEVVAACKIQGKCDFEVVSPSDPARSRGTLQFSWTFDASGFGGSTTIVLPPAAAVTNGCSAEASSVGTRR